jgi:uracil-DNA glycosylase family 4
VPTPLEHLNRRIIACNQCPRLREHCEQVARSKRAAYRDQTYWGRPVPGFGDPEASVWVIGLAPGAHGANRTGRVFTGDRSGDFLFASLHRAGLASRATSEHRDDGLVLRGVYVSAAARCAPPGNHPTKDELASCSAYLDAEWALLPRLHTILALGGIAWAAASRLIERQTGARLATKFGHGGEVNQGHVRLLGSYHVSQQNTFTGRLTPAMLDAVIARAMQS